MKLAVRYLLGVLTLGAMCLPSAVSAQQVAPGQHPEFLHALTDLRAARGYLEKMTPNEAVDADTSSAVHEIDSAIVLLKQASIDDGKNLNDHPPIDAHMQRSGRLSSAKQLLDQAHADVKQPEGDPAAAALQGRILAHIDAAHKYINQAIAARGGRP